MNIQQIENYHNEGVRAPHLYEGCPKDVQRYIIICRIGGRRAGNYLNHT